jgi:hypothetical protein
MIKTCERTKKKDKTDRNSLIGLANVDEAFDKGVRCLMAEAAKTSCSMRA